MTDTYVVMSEEDKHLTTTLTTISISGVATGKAKEAIMPAPIGRIFNILDFQRIIVLQLYILFLYVYTIVSRSYVGIFRLKAF